MNTKKIIILGILCCMTITGLRSASTSESWRVSLSNAYTFDKFDNIQLDLNRQFTQTWSLGIYGRYVNHIFNEMNTTPPPQPNYLPLGAYLPVGQSGQLGLQVEAHLLRTELPIDFWIQFQAGINISTRYNAAGTYWYYGDNRVPIVYTTAAKQHQSMVDPEVALNLGFSYSPIKNWSVFVSPGINVQILTKNYSYNTDKFGFSGFLTARWGVSYSF